MEKICIKYNKCSKEIEEAIKILIYSVQCYAPCGRLKKQEREAIKILREYVKENEEWNG